MWPFKRKTKEVRNFEAAGKGHRFSSWAQLGRTTSSLDHKTLRERARFLVKNNPYATASVRTLCAYLVGQGIKPHSSDKTFDKILKGWADTTTCDALGEQNLYGLESTMVHHLVVDGEVFIQKVVDEKSKVPLKLRVLEADYLDDSKNSSNGLLVNGIEFDEHGKRVSYYFFNSLQSNIRTSKKVPASDVIHLYRKDSASQTRGFSWLAPVILRMKDLDEYEDAELLRQKMSACFVGFFRDLEAMGEDPFTQQDGTPKEISPGSIFKAPSGQTLEFSNPPQTVGYASYIENAKLSIASGIGVPYMMLSGDYSRANYSSSRMSMLNFFRFIESLQSQILLPSLCLKIEEWLFNTLQLKESTPLQKALVWAVPRKEMVDPGRDIEAMKMAVDAGFRSHSDVIRELGDDPSDVYEEIKNCHKSFLKDGLNFNEHT